MKETQKKKIFLPLLQTAVLLSRALVCQAQQRSGRERLRFRFPGLVFPISRYDKWLSGCKETPCKQSVLKFQVSVTK